MLLNSFSTFPSALYAFKIFMGDFLICMNQFNFFLGFSQIDCLF
jgi:hypothetical protein